MIRITIIAAILAATLSGIGTSRGLGDNTFDADEPHVQWVAHAAERMDGIQPGMTRSALLKVFRPVGYDKGGDAFAYLDCDDFIVHAKFRKSLDGAGDVITQISRPKVEPQTFRGQGPWVSKMLSRMGTIRPGMTREDLLTEFQPAGGLYVTETFEDRVCPNFKVEVEFEPGLLRRSDVITEISAPFVQQVATD